MPATRCSIGSPKQPRKPAKKRAAIRFTSRQASASASRLLRALRITRRSRRISTRRLPLTPTTWRSTPDSYGVERWSCGSLASSRHRRGLRRRYGPHTTLAQIKLDLVGDLLEGVLPRVVGGQSVSQPSQHHHCFAEDLGSLLHRGLQVAVSLLPPSMPDATSDAWGETYEVART